MISLAEARARDIELPADDGAAQDIINEQESWLAHKIGPLEGARTETFYVGASRTNSKLGLRRPTDSVVITDGGPTVDTALVRLVDLGTAIERLASVGLQPCWTGPYVTATYTPNDADMVRSALFSLVALVAEPATAMVSETLGDYAYSKRFGSSLAHERAVIVGSLIPKRDALVAVAVSRQLGYGDPVINRAEPWT